MNKFIVVALLVAACTAKFSVKGTDPHIELAEMKKDAFGATLLSAVEMTLKSTASVSELTGLFDSILGDLEGDQATADALYETENNFCEETYGTLEEQHNYVLSTLEGLDNGIQNNREVLAQAKLSLNQAATDLDETNNSLEAGAAQRESEHNAWVNADYEHSQSIAALEEASKLIKHLIHGVSFAQVRERYEKVQEALKSNVQHASLFKPLLSALASVSTKLNYEQVVRILDLLKSIKEALEAAQEAAHQAEDQAQADWEALESHLQEQRRSLQDKIARLNSLITSTEEIIEALTVSRARYHAYNEYLIFVVDYLQAWCAERADLHNTNTTDRQRRIRILQALEEGLNDRFPAVSSFFEKKN
jgi:DNA repair exonuclease SbcCD ATPase subunit